MRMLYPDWKIAVAANIGTPLHWSMNELLWELYDQKLKPIDAAARLAELSNPDYTVIRSGFKGTVRAIIPKSRFTKTN